MAKLNIKVLGTGCQKCKTLEKLTRDVVAANQVDAEISKVEDIVEIMKYNIIATPALVINGKVVVKGMLPSANDIKKLIDKALNA
jgi:small redox-active disulfide protein 2